MNRSKFRSRRLIANETNYGFEFFFRPEFFKDCIQNLTYIWKISQEVKFALWCTFSTSYLEHSASLKLRRSYIEVGGVRDRNFGTEMNRYEIWVKANRRDRKQHQIIAAENSIEIKRKEIVFVKLRLRWSSTTFLISTETSRWNWSLGHLQLEAASDLLRVITIF